jgi:hypothetical protein
MADIVAKFLLLYEFSDNFRISVGYLCWFYGKVLAIKKVVFKANERLL